MEDLNSNNKQKQTDKQTCPSTGGSDEFNSFQFWREPVSSVDDSLLDLLVCCFSVVTDYLCHRVFLINYKYTNYSLYYYSINNKTHKQEKVSVTENTESKKLKSSLTQTPVED